MTDFRDPALSDRLDWDEPRASDRCRCGDMPGRCPGPHACPACQEPDMLEALRRAEQQLDYGQFDAAQDILRAAIVKATGGEA